MKSKINGSKLRVYISLTIFFAVLLIVGVLMRAKLQQLLLSYMEVQVTREAEVIAELTEEKINLELVNLRKIAEYLERSNTTEEVILSEVVGGVNNTGMKGVTAGLLALDGSAVCGEVLDFKEFPSIQESFRGNESVCFSEEKGILFTTPVYAGKNVKYVIYKLYANELIFEHFGFSCYGGKGDARIITRDEKVVLEFQKAESASYFEEESVQESMQGIRDLMNVSTVASKYSHAGKSENFLFAAQIGQTDLFIIGIVPEYLMSEGISYIIALVLWVFGLLLVLFAIGVAYLFVAEQKARESDKLRVAKSLAEQASRAKSDFLANMSHEIRTPINAVIGMNEMILRENKDENIQVYAQDIRSASNSLLSLINDILDFSKIESGKMEIIPVEYKVASLLKDSYNMVFMRAQDKNLELSVANDATIPSELFGDEVRIRQIMINILTNAVKYTKEGSVSLRMDWELKEEDWILLKIRVKDTGIGISPENQKKLFSSFQRVDEKQNRNIEGTGLGLTITKRLVDLMGGKIFVESEYGKGSEFIVEIPQKIISREPVGVFSEFAPNVDGEQQGYKERFQAPEGRILVVDDVPMNLKVMKGLLKETKLQIDTAESGMQCLELIKQKKYHIIFLDHMMPQMDGIETLQHMREMEENQNKDVPIIMLTANAISGAKEEYLSQGFHDYLTKPIYEAELEKMILQYLPEEVLQNVDKTIVMPQQVTENKISKEETEVEAIGEKKTFLEQLAFLDTETGLMYCGGMEEFYREILGEYAVNGRYDTLQEMFAKKDWENYRIQVHALKSTSLSIGAPELSERARLLEMAVKDGDYVYIQEHHAGVMEQYEKLLHDLQSVLEKWSIHGR